MVVIGVDSHKRTHTVVAPDGTGRKLAEKTVAATSAGHLELVRWAARFATRTFVLEDCRHLSRRLSNDLLRAGRGRHPGPAQAHGRRSPVGPGTRQERPDRRPGRRPRGPARTGPAGRPPSTGPSATSGCWSTTARTSSPSGRAPRTGCAGISTSSTPATSRRPAASIGRSSSTPWSATSPRRPARSAGSPANWSSGSVT